MLHHLTQHIHSVGVTKSDGCLSLLDRKWFSHSIFFLRYLIFPLRQFCPSQKILDQTVCAAIGQEVRNFPSFTPLPFRGRHAPSLSFALLPQLHPRLKPSLPSPSPFPSHHHPVLTVTRSPVPTQTSSAMRLPTYTYSPPGFAPFFFNTENWDVFSLRDPSRKRKFQGFCEHYMDRVRKGESNSDEIDKFTALLKGDQPEYFRLARAVVPEFQSGTV